MLCARVRDIPPIVASIMQIAFFMTPVMWKPELLGGGAHWLPLNPFYAIMETVRGPLVGTGVSLTTWASALCYSALLCVVAQIFFARFRERIAFWV
jgi:lipopolysaccharide transport system permease protein